MQDAEIQSVIETVKVRKEWQASWVITSPTKWGCIPFKMKRPPLENCTQTTHMLKHEAILFYGISRHNSFYIKITWIFTSFIYATMMSCSEALKRSLPITPDRFWASEKEHSSPVASESCTAPSLQAGVSALSSWTADRWNLTVFSLQLLPKEN